MPIVVETDQFPNCGNSPSRSRAEIFDGLRDGIWLPAEEICAEKSARYDASE
jgi:hypothetical protein